MERGDIWHVDLDPTAGREQAHARPVLILTPARFNALGTPIVAPITSGGDFARRRGFAVPIDQDGAKTKGVVLCHQIRALDLEKRKARFWERAPDDVVEDVLAKVQTLFE